MDKRMQKFLLYILLLFMSPMAFLLLILVALLNILLFLMKATLLFSIATINTPLALMGNASLLAATLLAVSLRPSWDMSNFDPRLAVGIEFKTIVSNFFKIIAAELLLVLSTGVITFYTAPKLVFFISMVVGVTAIVLKWLNTPSLSKTAFSCICDGYGLNSMMFFFSFIGLFDIGCHPIAKCSFVAAKAFVLQKKVPSEETKWFIFNGGMITSENSSIEFFNCNLSAGDLFKLIPRIDFIKRNNGQYILKSFMVLKLLGAKLCEYPVERLELPEDYSKFNELYNFLDTVSSDDGFVTYRMSGRYEHSLTLSEIADGVEESVGFKIVYPNENWFVVAGCTDLHH